MPATASPTYPRPRPSVPSDFHPVLARMFAEVAGSNGKEGAKEGGDNNASVRPSVHPTFVCEAENESQLSRELRGGVDGRGPKLNNTLSGWNTPIDGAQLSCSCPSSQSDKQAVCCLLSLHLVLLRA